MAGITYTDPSVLAGIAAGADWADPTMDPTTIDWPARQAKALIPFRVVDGRPVNPCESTGIRYGRNQLGHWGEQQCADALVIATDSRGQRWIAMVERADGAGWALPGGYVNPGEEPAIAAARELVEEAGLTLPMAAWQVSPPRYVPDPRASDEAWMVTVLARTEFDLSGFPPRLTAGDDARSAAWFRANSYDDLTAWMKHVRGGEIFAAHRTMLADALTEVTQ